MSFLSSTFVALLAAVVVLQAAVPGRRAKNLVLLVASLVFYGWIHPWFLAPLLVSATVDYFAAIAVEDRPRHRNRWLWLSVVTNLGLLGFFKYHGFFAENVGAAFAALGLDLSLPTWKVVVPLGISFYTFQSLGYTFAVHQGEARARRDPLDYLLFATFFPQLVAGPIHEPEHLLPQIERPRTLAPAPFVSGVSLALWGAFKKVCVADRIAPDVDAIFGMQAPSFPLIVAGSVAFGLQLYADFSGYTDIARGVGRMLGFELAINFDRPFLATSTPSFWRRWHISLSRWVGRILYEPIVRSGPRSGARVALALMVTFLVLGLWHGAAWTFLVLGAFQGLAAIAYTLGWPLLPAAVRRSPVFLALAWAVHTLFVLVPSGLLFRETSLARVAAHLGRIATPSSPEDLTLAWATLGSVVALSGVIAVGSEIPTRLGRRLARPWALLAHAGWWMLALVLVDAMRRPLLREFVYFRF